MAGLEGYGFYFKLLEVVAELMDGTNKCSATYSLTKWSHLLYIHHNKFSKLLGNCEVAGLVTVKYRACNPPSTSIGNPPSKAGVMIEVIIPNLLKYRDNHTKNLQVAYKQELELELELELDKNKPNKTINSAKKPAEIPAEKNLEIAGKELTILQIACKDTWAKYANAYFTKYGALPVRNSKVNSNVKNFVQRIGADEAPQISAWYVNHTNNFYARDAHGFGLLAKDAEKLRTEWVTGRIVDSSGFKTIAERRSRMDISKIDYKAGINADGSF